MEKFNNNPTYVDLPLPECFDEPPPPYSETPETKAPSDPNSNGSLKKKSDEDRDPDLRDTKKIKTENPNAPKVKLALNGLYHQMTKNQRGTFALHLGDKLGGWATLEQFVQTDRPEVFCRMLYETDLFKNGNVIELLKYVEDWSHMANLRSYLVGWQMKQPMNDEDEQYIKSLSKYVY